MDVLAERQWRHSTSDGAGIRFNGPNGRVSRKAMETKDSRLRPWDSEPLVRVRMDVLAERQWRRLLPFSKATISRVRMDVLAERQWRRGHLLLARRLMDSLRPNGRVSRKAMETYSRLPP